MAMFSYACGDCGMSYEVSREPARADAEAFCPVCGIAISRVREGRLARARGFAKLFVHVHGTGPGQHRHW